MIPCGKAFQIKTWRQVILVNLALAAVALPVRLDPWSAPGEVALLDLVREPIPWVSLLQALGILSRPLGQVDRPVLHQI